MTTEEKNLVIAEYMGWTIHKGTGKDFGYSVIRRPDGTKKGVTAKGIEHLHLPDYELNWNHLMPVIQKLKQDEPKEGMWEPTDDLWDTIYFDISKEHEEVYERIMALKK